MEEYRVTYTDGLGREHTAYYEHTERGKKMAEDKAIAMDGKFEEVKTEDQPMPSMTM